MTLHYNAMLSRAGLTEKLKAGGSVLTAGTEQSPGSRPAASQPAIRLPDLGFAALIYDDTMTRISRSAMVFKVFKDWNK